MKNKISNKKFVLYKPHEFVSELVEYYYTGGFYRVNNYMYPNVSDVLRKAKRYSSRKRAETAAKAASKYSLYDFKVMELEV